ncbi:MAG: DUF402 domain-containing protein [Chloroflexi bacterium]|nr:DUF402 domain-containing protein [Chloroflexota bacterium]
MLPTRLLVRKLRPDGSQAFAWNATLLRHEGTEIVLAARFNVDSWQVGDTVLRRGDEFREFYYADRAYNVFQVFSPGGTLKGWYCNVSTPADLDLERGELRYTDLVLDLWVSPEGQQTRLDEDELAERRANGEISADLLALAERGWADLLALAAAHALPSWTDAR